MSPCEYSAIFVVERSFVGLEITVDHQTSLSLTFEMFHYFNFEIKVEINLLH